MVLKDYNLGHVLGKGAFATVYYATHRVTGRECALKVVDRTKLLAAGPRGLKFLKSEIDCLSKVQHPSVVRLYESFDLGGQVYLAMELLRGGELFDKVLELQCYPESAARELTRNLLEAVALLHENGVCHRDIKLENVMLKDKVPEGDTQGLSKVTLIDFGVAASFEPGHAQFDLHCGSPDYMAPEVVAVHQTGGGRYDEKCDLWSLGVLTFIVLCGWPPFFASSTSQLYQKIRAGEYAFLEMTVWDQISSAAKDFVAMLLTVDPVMRPSAVMALRHPWMYEGEAFIPRLPISQQPFTERSRELSVVGSILQTPLSTTSEAVFTNRTNDFRSPDKENRSPWNSPASVKSSKPPTRGGRDEGTSADWGRYTIGDLLLSKPKQNLVSISAQAPISSAFELLAEQHILSCPVIEEGRLQGFVDVLHLLKTVTDVCLRQLQLKIQAGVPPELPSEFTLKPQAWEFERPVGHFIAPELRARAHLFPPNTPLLQVLMDAFVSPPHGRRVHRVAVSAAHDSRVHHIVTQTDVMQFLLKQRKPVGLMRATLEALHVDCCHVWTVTNSAPALSALLLMQAKDVTAVGVVDRMTGALVGNFSASDLRGFTAEDLPTLCVPVDRFLRSRSRNSRAHMPVRPIRPITCDRHSTLSAVLDLMQDHHIHRVYVVDSCGAPESVVTLTDVLRIAVQAAIKPGTAKTLKELTISNVLPQTTADTFHQPHSPVRA